MSFDEQYAALSGLGQREKLRFIQKLANPAAGAEWQDACPGGLIRQPLSVVCTLTTSATVSNRSPALSATDGSNEYAIQGSASTQAASITNKYGFGFLAGFQTNVLANLMNSGIPFLILDPGFIFRSVTNNLQVGDQWSLVAIQYFQVLELPARWEQEREQRILDGVQPATGILG